MAGTQKNGADSTKTAPTMVQLGINPGDTPEVADLKRQLADKQKENEELKARKALPAGFGEVSCKIKPVGPAKDKKGNLIPGKESGGVLSIYGLGAYPLSIYLEKLPEVFSPEMLVKICEETISKISIGRFGGSSKKSRTAAQVEEARAATLANAKALLALFKPLCGKFKPAALPKGSEVATDDATEE